MTELPIERYLRTFDVHDDLGTAEPPPDYKPKYMKDVKTGKFTKPKPVRKSKKK